MMRTTMMVVMVAALAAICWTSCGDGQTGGGGGSSASCTPGADCPANAVDSDCLALVDNSGKDVFALRLAQLSVTEPAVLASPLVEGIIGDGVNSNMPSCNVAGKGTFSFIMEIDKTAGTLRAGGAWPEADPTHGYCYVFDAPNGISPMTVTVTVGADGIYSAAPVPLLVVPIFLDLDAVDVIYLPLREAALTGMKVSSDQNCVGKFNVDGLSPVDNCKAVPNAGIYYYLDDGDLDGYVTLEEADQVLVAELQESLCVLLSGAPSTYGDGATPAHCTRDGNGKILLEGNWCSQTDSADGCKDSMKLHGTIAASAVEIRSDCPSGAGGGGAGGGGPTGGAGVGGA